MSKNFRVSLTAKAEDDLIGIWFSVFEDSPANADRLLDNLNARIESLHENPDRGAPRPELGHDIRMLIEGKYLIIYRVENAAVSILRVLHGARDLREIFDVWKGF